MQADSQHMRIDNCAEAFVKSPKSFQRLPPDSSAPAGTSEDVSLFQRTQRGEREGRGREEVVGKWKWAVGR